MCVPSPPSLGARLHPPRPLVLLHAACGGVARAAGARAAVALRAAALPARARAVPRAVGRDARRGASASGGGLIARWLETSQGSLGAASRVRGRGSPFRLDLWVHATAVGGGSECGPRVHELGYPRPTRTTLWPCARRGGDIVRSLYVVHPVVRGGVAYFTLTLYDTQSVFTAVQTLESTGRWPGRWHTHFAVPGGVPGAAAALHSGGRRLSGSLPGWRVGVVLGRGSSPHDVLPHPLLQARSLVGTTLAANAPGRNGEPPQCSRWARSHSRE